MSRGRRMGRRKQYLAYKLWKRGWTYRQIAERFDTYSGNIRAIVDHYKALEGRTPPENPGPSTLVVPPDDRWPIRYLFYEGHTIKEISERPPAKKFKLNVKVINDIIAFRGIYAPRNRYERFCRLFSVGALLAGARRRRLKKERRLGGFGFDLSEVWTPPKREDKRKA